MTKASYELSAKLLRLGNRGARKAQARARRAGVRGCYAVNDKLVQVKL